MVKSLKRLSFCQKCRKGDFFIINVEKVDFWGKFSQSRFLFLKNRNFELNVSPFLVTNVEKVDFGQIRRNFRFLFKVSKNGFYFKMSKNSIFVKNDAKIEFWTNCGEVNFWWKKSIIGQKCKKADFWA